MCILQCAYYNICSTYNNIGVSLTPTALIAKKKKLHDVELAK